MTEEKWVLVDKDLYILTFFWVSLTQWKKYGNINCDINFIEVFNVLIYFIFLEIKCVDYATNYIFKNIKNKIDEEDDNFQKYV